MKVYRPLRLVLFAYEFIRLIIIISLISAAPEGERSVPYLVYAASNALYPLMAFFMWFNLSEYRSYVLLYTAGKCIAAAAAAGWVFFFLRNIPAAAGMGGLPAPLSVLLFAVLDILSILAGILIIGRVNRIGGPE
jgi:hypothetical protein